MPTVTTRLVSLVCNKLPPQTTCLCLGLFLSRTRNSCQNPSSSVTVKWCHQGVPPTPAELFSKTHGNPVLSLTNCSNTEVIVGERQEKGRHRHTMNDKPHVFLKLAKTGKKSREAPHAGDYIQHPVLLLTPKAFLSLER